jgi:hypothetical protein
MIVIGGYDDDPRALWDIPEARAFIERFGWEVMGRLQRPLEEWKLDMQSVALIAVCVGAGRVTGRNPDTGDWPRPTIDTGGEFNF